MDEYWQRKSSYLLNDSRNFNEIFRKDVTYDNVKLQKTRASLSLTPSSRLRVKVFVLSMVNNLSSKPFETRFKKVDMSLCSLSPDSIAFILWKKFVGFFS